MKPTVIANQGQWHRKPRSTIIGKAQDDTIGFFGFGFFFPKSCRGVQKKVIGDRSADKIGGQPRRKNGNDVPVLVPFGDIPKVHINDMEPDQLLFIKGIVFRITHIETVIFQPSDEIIIFCVDLYGQIEKRLVALRFYARIVRGHVQVFYPKNIGALRGAQAATEYYNEGQQPPVCTMVK